jgi:hypothetical protein
MAGSGRAKVIEDSTGSGRANVIGERSGSTRAQVIGEGHVSSEDRQGILIGSYRRLCVYRTEE